MPADTIFTIGHSTHAAERFLELLSAHRITAIGDVRSQPYSRVNPQFNREAILATLRSAGIAYVFLERNSAPAPRTPPATSAAKCNTTGWRKPTPFAEASAAFARACRTTASP